MEKPEGSQGEGEAEKEADGADEPSAEAEAAAQQSREAAIARAVRGKWVSDSGQGVGERDYAPGYAQLLEGDLVFGDPDTDPDGRALRALLQDAQAVHALLMLGDGDPRPADASEEAA